jgi:transcriptional regulator with GAF, ATPase, and Fis domain
MSKEDGVMLAHMTRRLVQNSTFDGVIQTILDDVIALLGAEYGNVQLPVGDELAIAAQRGLSTDFLKVFRRVKKDDSSACGRAFRERVSVIIPDIEKDAAFAAFRQEANNAGFQAVQSTPLATLDGKLLGVVSTHFANPHEPTPIEMETMMQYGSVAAEYAFMLLAEHDASLAVEAEQMSTELYGTLAEEALAQSIETANLPANSLLPDSQTNP